MSIPRAIKSQVKSVRQRGFAMLELMMAISIAAMLSIYAAQQLTNQAEETLAEGSANYIVQVTGAAQRQTLLSFNEYAAGLPIVGLVDPLKPTVTELVALGRLNAGFPTAAGSLPTRQTLRIDVAKSAVCTAAACTLTVLACTTAPVTLGGANVRFDLASTMVDKQGGGGGQSLPGAGTIIRGPSLNVANPVAGNPEGIVCGSSVIDTTLYLQFVKINDSRDPNLQGPLTVAGATNINNSLTVTGLTTLGSVGNDVNVGGKLTAAGATSINSSLAVTGATTLGSVGNDVGVGGKLTVSGVTAMNSSATVSGSLSADRLTPVGLYAAGAACGAADEGSIARNTAALGLVLCQAGAWRTLATGAASGDACATSGAMATSALGVSLLCVNGSYQGMDTIVRSGTPGSACTVAGATAIDTANGNETLICRWNLQDGTKTLRYMRLRDVTTHLVFVSATEVTDSTAVGGTGPVLKPDCSPSSTQTAIPILQLILKSFASPDGGVAAWAVDNNPGLPGTWSVFLRQGDSTKLLNGAPNATAVAQVFCYFP